jgi:hypothetical protein
MMEDHVYKHIELTGSSETGLEQAIQSAVGRAAHSLRNLEWFEVTDLRGTLWDGKVARWQVTLKVGFRVDEEEDDD